MDTDQNSSRLRGFFNRKPRDTDTAITDPAPWRIASGVGVALPDADNIYTRPIRLDTIRNRVKVEIEKGGYTPSSQELDTYRDDINVVVYEFLQNLSYGLGHKPPPIVLIELKNGKRIPYLGDPDIFPDENQIASIQFITANPNGITQSQATLNLREESKAGLGHWARGLKFAAVTLFEKWGNQGVGIDVQSTYRHGVTRQQVNWIGKYSFDQTTDGKSKQLNMHWANAPKDTPVNQTIFTITKPPREFIKALKNTPDMFLYMNPNYRGGVFVPGNGEKNSSVTHAAEIAGMTVEVLDDQIGPNRTFPAYQGFVDGVRFQINNWHKPLMYNWHFAGGLNDEKVPRWARIYRGSDSKSVEGLDNLPKVLRKGLNTGALGIEFWDDFLERMYQLGFTEEIGTPQIEAKQINPSPSPTAELENQSFYTWDFGNGYTELSPKGQKILQEALLNFLVRHPDIKAINDDAHVGEARRKHQQIQSADRYRVLVCYGLYPLIEVLEDRPPALSTLTERHVKEASMKAAPVETFQFTPVMEAEFKDQPPELLSAIALLAKQDGINLSVEMSTGRLVLSQNVGQVYIAKHPENMFPKTAESLEALAAIVYHIQKASGIIKGTFMETGTDVATFQLGSKLDGRILKVFANGEVRDSYEYSSSSKLQLEFSLPGDQRELLRQIEMQFRQTKDDHRRQLAEMDPETIHRRQVDALERQRQAKEQELQQLRDNFTEQVEAEVAKRVDEEIARRKAKELAKIAETDEALAKQIAELEERKKKALAKQAEVEALEAEREAKRLKEQAEIERKKLEKERLDKEIETRKRYLRDFRQQVIKNALQTTAKSTTAITGAGGATYITLEHVLPWLREQEALRQGAIRVGTKVYDFYQASGLPHLLGKIDILKKKVTDPPNTPELRLAWNIGPSSLVIDALDVVYLPPSEIEAIQNNNQSEADRSDGFILPPPQEIRRRVGVGMVSLEGLSLRSDLGGFYRTSFSNSMELNKSGDYVSGSFSGNKEYRGLNLPGARPDTYLKREIYTARLPKNTWSPLAIRLGESPVAFRGIKQAEFQQNLTTGGWEVKITDDYRELEVFTDRAKSKDLAYLYRQPDENDLKPWLDEDTLRADIRQAIADIKNSSLTYEQKIDEVLAVWRRVYLYDKGKDVKDEFPRDNLQVYTSAMINKGLGPCGYAAYGAAALLRAAGIPTNVLGGFVNEQFGSELTLEELHATILVWNDSKKQWHHIEPQIGRATQRLTEETVQSNVRDQIQATDEFIQILASTPESDQLQTIPQTVLPVDMQWNISEPPMTYADKVALSDGMIIMKAPEKAGEEPVIIANPQLGIYSTFNPELEKALRLLERQKRVEAVIPFAAAGAGGALSLYFTNWLQQQIRQKIKASKTSEEPIASNPPEQ